MRTCAHPLVITRSPYAKTGDMASKSTVEYTARRITYQTPLPLSEVIARLDKEINKPGGGLPLFRLLRDAKERTELEEGINALTQGRDFVYVRAPLVSRWMHPC